METRQQRHMPSNFSLPHLGRLQRRVKSRVLCGFVVNELLDCQISSRASIDIVLSTSPLESKRFKLPETHVGIQIRGIERRLVLRHRIRR